MATVVNSTTFQQDFNTVLEGLAQDAFKLVLNHFEGVVDENGNKLNFNIADICNTITQTAQAARKAAAAQ